MSRFKLVSCYSCHEEFGLEPATEASLRRSSVTFYCPWGHPLHFPQGESAETTLRRERDRLKQDAARLHQEIANTAAQRDAAERRASAAKGQITKLKKRSAEGRCPCCNRVFVDLLSHMKSKHAEYEAAEIVLEEDAPPMIPPGNGGCEGEGFEETPRPETFNRQRRMK